MRERLKRETAALHGRLEAQLGLLEPGLSMRRYRELLETFYGFYGPVETSLVRIAAMSPPRGFCLRIRSQLLEDDLQALGLTRRQLAELPRCISLPPLSNEEQLAGCLYVLEGASLGGRVIARALDRDLGIAKEGGASFFVGDAEATSARWRKVVAWLDGLDQGALCSDAVVAAAQATFVAFAHWAEERLVCGPSTGEQEEATWSS